MFFIEKIGRRPLLLTLGIANTLTLASYVVFDRLTYYADNNFRYGCILAFILYGVTYGFALGPIAFFITAELVPQNFRSLVQSIVFAINTVINFVVSFATLPLYRMIDSYAFLLLFVLPSSISIVYLFFNLPETRSKEIHDIVSSLMPRRHHLSSPTNELATESGMSTKSACTNDSLSYSEDEEEVQCRPLNPGNFSSNICLGSNKIVIEKF